MNNGAAIGYMILAAKQAEMDYEFIQCLEKLMLRAMDEYTEDEAEEIYRNN